MAQITEEGNSWKLTIFPEGQPVEEIKEPTKGYRALLGYDAPTDRHVVMYVWYDKSMYPIGEVLKKIDEMKACPRCNALDKARLDNLTIETQSPAQQVRYSQPSAVPQTQPRSNVKDMFANAMFDAYLTPAGKMMVGNVFGDQQLVEDSFPKSPEELAQLWSDTTTGKLLRSPQEAKDFMSIIQGTDTPEEKKKTVKRASQGIVIY